MNDDQYAELVAALKRARRSPKPYAWFFCMKGSDGVPLLLVGKRASEVKQEGKQLRKTADDKRGGRGLLVVDEAGRFVFGLDEGNAPANIVQKMVRTKLALDPGLKKVKGLLQKARVLEEDEFAEVTTAEVDEEAEEVDTSELERRLDAARAASKKAWDAAVGRVGTSHPELAALVKLQEKGKKARQEALALVGKDPTAAEKRLKIAVSLYEELADSAAAVGHDDDDDDEDEADEGEEEEDTRGRGGRSVDPAALAEQFAAAMETVSRQMEALRKALVATGDPDLVKIAEQGLSALTDGHRVKLQTALTEARGASASDRPKALARVAKVADDFLDRLDHEVVDACEDNPFGVKVTIRKTLGRTLRQLAAAG